MAMANSSNDQKWSVHPRDLLWIKDLGEGAFGVVRKCYCTKRGGVRAVKFFKKLSTKSIELQREVLTRILDHSHLLLPVGYGVSSGGHHIIMTDCAPHGDLQSLLDTQQLSLERRVEMALEIAQGAEASSVTAAIPAPQLPHHSIPGCY